MEIARYLRVRVDPHPRHAWIFLLAGLFWLALAGAAQAAGLTLQVQPDRERLVIDFGGPIPAYTLGRTESTELTLTLGSGSWPGGQTPATPTLALARLVSGVLVSQEGMSLTVSTNGFGYMHYPISDTSIAVDLFQDPVGAHWSPEDSAPVAAAEPEPEPEPVVEPEPAPAAEPEVAAAQEPEPAPEPVIESEPAPEAAPEAAPEPAPEAAPAETEGPQFEVRVLEEPEAQAVLAEQGAAAGNEPRPEAAAAPAPAEPAPAEPAPEVAATGPGEVRGSLRHDVAPAEAAPVALPAVEAPAEAAPAEEAAPPAEEAAAPAEEAAAPAEAAPVEEPPVEAATLDNATAEGPPATPAEPPHRRDEPGVVHVPIHAGATDQTPTEAGPAQTAQPEETLPEEVLPPEEASPGETQPVETAAEEGPDQAQPAEMQPDVSQETQPEVSQETPGEVTQETPAEVAQETPPADMAQENATAEEGQQGEVPPGEELPDYETLILTGRATMNNGDYATAYDVFSGLKRDPRLPQEYREEVLYSLAELEFTLHRDELDQFYEPVRSAYIEAMNYNLDSERVPDALLSLGLLNLRVGNVNEAEAYFNLLKSEYPEHANVPLTYYYWGEYFFNRQEYDKAAEYYDYLVQHYPDNRYVREAALGLAESLNYLGYHDQAAEYAQFIEVRWPRFYETYPPFLRLVGEISYRNGDYAKARWNYWLYYNLDPNVEDAHLVLARLGDIYTQMAEEESSQATAAQEAGDPEAADAHLVAERDLRKAAQEVYEQTAFKFPDQEGGLIAQMRLAEQGVLDEPTVEDMFTVFDRPYNLQPVEIYTQIVEKYPDSSLAPLAQLKLAMWDLWNDRYFDTLDDVGTFLERFPESELADRAREVAFLALNKLAATLVNENNFHRLTSLWNEHPYLAQAEDLLTPETRVSMAMSFAEDGNPDEALRLLEPIFDSAGMPEYSEMALQMALKIYLENQAWQEVLDLAERKDQWELSPQARTELDYALALAYENLDMPDRSGILWRKLAEEGNVEPERMGYILFFLALEAKDEGRLKDAYDHAIASLDAMLQMQDVDMDKVQDLLSLLVGVTESAGRYTEALSWAQQYFDYAPPDDPNGPAMRYRMAQIYKKLADIGMWRSILEELVAQSPDSLYGRMAATELSTYTLEQEASQFAPQGSM